MERYRNLGGNSGVYAYETGNNHITVQFSDGGVYLYNHLSPGNFAVEQMKRLAASGRGLNSYISKYIRKRYAAKIR